MSLGPFYNVAELKNTKKAIFIDLYAASMFLMHYSALPFSEFREDISDRELLDIVKESVRVLKSHNISIYIDQCTNSIKILHDISIFDTGLDKNLCHVLDRYGVSTIGKLLSENRINLKSWRLIGNVRYNQIIKFVDDHGFRFFDEINTPTDEDISMHDELINTKILDIKYEDTSDICEEDAFILVVEHLDYISYTITEYMKIAPIFKKYVEDKTISEEKILYKQLDLEALTLVSNRNIKTTIDFSSLKVVTETIYDIFDLVDPAKISIFGKEDKHKSTNSIFLKYTVNKYIPLSNGYIFGYDISDISAKV